jgi:hypothetical protein
MRVRTVRYPWPVLDAAFPRSLKRRARNIVLRERAGDTNTQDNYDRRAQPIRDLVHSRPPAVAGNDTPPEQSGGIWAFIISFITAGTSKG